MKFDGIGFPVIKSQIEGLKGCDLCWFAIVGLDYYLVTKKLEQRNENDFFFFTKNLLEIKKLFENIKNKFWLIKNILRKLKEKNKEGKNW